MRQQKTQITSDVGSHPFRKTRKTKSEDSTESDGAIDFKHLVDSSEETVDTTEEEDEAISDAIAFITSDAEEKKKRRRPVRRKKSSD